MPLPENQVEKVQDLVVDIFPTFCLNWRMLGETKNCLSLTRAALSTRGGHPHRTTPLGMIISSEYLRTKLKRVAPSRTGDPEQSQP